MYKMTKIHIRSAVEVLEHAKRISSTFCIKTRKMLLYLSVLVHLKVQINVYLLLPPHEKEVGELIGK